MFRIAAGGKTTPTSVVSPKLDSRAAASAGADGKRSSGRLRLGLKVFIKASVPMTDASCPSSSSRVMTPPFCTARGSRACHPRKSAAAAWHDFEPRPDALLQLHHVRDDADQPAAQLQILERPRRVRQEELTNTAVAIRLRRGGTDRGERTRVATAMPELALRRRRIAARERADDTRHRQQQPNPARHLQHRHRRGVCGWE